MRASRLLTILLTMQMEGRTTARSLADKLEVSKRTIYRDIDELSAAGVPVFAERGADGGFALLDGFKAQLTGLTAAESEAMLLAGVPAAAADLGLAVPAAAARLKLLAALPEASRAGAERVAALFHLDPSDWYRRARVPEHLSTVAKALWDGRAIKLLYESWTRTAHVRVEPLGLIMKAGRWYVLAGADDTQRIYRVDKMHAVTILDAACRRPIGFDLASAWAEASTRFEASLKQGKATLRVSPGSLDRLDRLGFQVAEPLLAAEPDELGWRRAVVPIEGVTHAAGLLLGFADEIEVLEPTELRHELARRAEQVAALYRTDAHSNKGNAAVVR